MTAHPELEIAMRAARGAAPLLLRHFRAGVQVRTKGVADLVSDADMQAEEAIVALLRAERPGHAVLAEEAHRADTAAEHLWVVDPLDGTTNFAHGLPHFSVSIAYCREGRPECAVVHNPARDDWYVAVRGGGATHNGAALRVAPTARLDESLVGVGFYYDRGAMMEATLDAIRDLFGRGIHGIRRIGTASLDLCHVAAGIYGAYFEYELAPWDFAAGRLIVEEAGGRVTTCAGEPLPLERSTLLASNGHLHETVQAIVAAHAAASGSERAGA